MTAPEVTREQVLGYRAWAHGLDRRPGGADLVLSLGVQDTPHPVARTALAVRGVTDLGDLATLWSWRGAPHVHHPRDAAFLAAALWPVSDADAQKRIASPVIRDGARRGIEAFTEAASAMRAAVTGRLLKGEVSTLVSARIPADLTFECPTCRARHISGLLFQQVGLAAGVQVETEGRNTYLSPLSTAVRPKQVPVQAERSPEALLRYVELHAPASPAQLATFLGTTRTVAAGLLPEGLVEVSGPAGAGWVTPAALERMRAADRPRLTRLLPASDPWLQARDRDVVVPDENRRKLVWAAISGPGVLLVDGEVTGTWRAKVQRGRLVVTVGPFGPLPARVRQEIEDESQLLAAARGAGCAEVVVS